MKHYIALLFALTLWGKVMAQNNQAIKFNDGRIRYEGRIGRPDSMACEFYWSGTSATVNFQGTGISAWLNDQGTSNYYTIVVDNHPLPKMHLSAGRQLYPLVQNLPEGKHTVTLFKDTEWSFGKTWFYGLELTGNGQFLSPPKAKKHKIEFYGNSITCGYANEDTITKGNSSEARFENNYMAYGAITARHFDAVYQCIGKSGIGLTVGWTPYTMPEIYDRLNPNDSTSKWTFADYKPNIVVINLGENDASVSNMPNHANFKARFGTRKPSDAYFVQAYQHFFSAIRSKYPSAMIIAVLGDMSAARSGQPWPGYIIKAVSNLHDRKMLTYFFKPLNASGHPLIKDDQQMAGELISFIETHAQW